MSDQQQMTILEQAGAVQRTPSILEIFAQLARDPTIDVARIQQLMEMQRWAEEREAEKQFIAAMNRLQPKLPRIQKRGRIAFESKRTGDSQSTPYARYEDIDKQIRPLLHEEGFSIAFGTSALEKGGILITATLSHAAGHSRTDSMPLPLDTSGSKNSIQAVGSTMAYGRRYLTCAMLNIITVGDDDDGNGISYIDEQGVNNIINLIADCEMTAEMQKKFLKWLNIEKIESLLARDYEKAYNFLTAKAKERRQGVSK